MRLHMGLVRRWSTTLLLPTGHRSNERPSFFLSRSISLFLFLSRCTHFYPPVAFFRKDSQEYKRCAERARKYRTVAKRSTFIVRCRCTRCRVLFSYRSKCARSMYRRARWEKLNSLNPMVSIRKSFWSLYFIQALSDFEKVIFEQNQL